ncbi:hypothetical protein DFJ73DRAFT_776550 [Zopfochytrium polystomum]|nr:hypothetical protein DFJ73DRAFT_776550 [Zopfochytrium polystomum]
MSSPSLRAFVVALALLLLALVASVEAGQGAPGKNGLALNKATSAVRQAGVRAASSSVGRAASAVGTAVTRRRNKFRQYRVANMDQPAVDVTEILPAPHYVPTWAPANASSILLIKKLVDVRELRTGCRANIFGSRPPSD